MNINLLRHQIGRGISRGGLYLQKYSPQILLGAGLVGGVTAAVLAVRAAKKDNLKAVHAANMAEIEHIVVEHDLSNEEAMQVRAGVYVQTGLQFTKLYGPAIGLGVFSISAILGAHGIMAKRQTALAAGFALLSETYQAYRDRVVEELGEEKDQMFHLGLRETDEETEIHVNADGTTEVRTKKVKKKLIQDRHGLSMYARCFDNSNPQWSSDRLINRAFLVSQQNFINDKLIIEGHVFLNDVYERLGFPHTPEGQLVGWVLKDARQMKDEGRDGYISFGMDKALNVEWSLGQNDAVWLDFNVDGEVYRLI